MQMRPSTATSAKASTPLASCPCSMPRVAGGSWLAIVAAPAQRAAVVAARPAGISPIMDMACLLVAVEGEDMGLSGLVDPSDRGSAAYWLAAVMLGLACAWEVQG
jgi:hypothetical protein